MSNPLENLLPDALAGFLLSLDTPLVTGFAVLLLVLFDRALQKRSVARARRQATMLALTVGALLAIAATLDPASREQLLKLTGVLLSAAIALSSTSLIGHFMAGLMLRAQRHFRSGDYVRVGEHFGRVSERGLFFTEIQNSRRDLVTLPNTLLANQAIEVIRSPATLLCAEVSLGYDVPRGRVEELLIEAAQNAGLTDAFVHILSLGDFSIVYRVSGLLEDISQLLSRESQLRGAVLDALHAGGVEIVSPNFMNQRVLRDDQIFIPQATADGEPPAAADAKSSTPPEKLMFDKADEAASTERLADLASAVEEKIERLRKERDDAPSEERQALDKRLERYQARQAWLVEMLEKRKGS